MIEESEYKKLLDDNKRLAQALLNTNELIIENDRLRLENERLKNG